LTTLFNIFGDFLKFKLHISLKILHQQFTFNTTAISFSNSQLVTTNRTKTKLKLEELSGKGN